MGMDSGFEFLGAFGYVVCEVQSIAEEGKES